MVRRMRRWGSHRSPVCRLNTRVALSVWGVCCGKVGGRPRRNQVVCSLNLPDASMKLASGKANSGELNSVSIEKALA